MLEGDDEYTGMHSRDVVALPSPSPSEMGLDERARRNVEFGALLHDIGKIAVPNEIINKPGQLDAEEWAVMRTHTVEGQRMLDRVGGVLERRRPRSCAPRTSAGTARGYPDGARRRARSRSRRRSSRAATRSTR